MEKSKFNNIDYYFIEEKKFKTNSINVVFSSQIDKESTTLRNLLPRILANKTAKYPKVELLNNYLDNLFGASLKAGVSRIGDVSYIRFSITYLQSSYLNCNIEQEIIELLKEVIYNPILIDGKLEKTAIEREKEELINTLLSRRSSFSFQARKEAIQLLYQDTTMAIDPLDNEEVIYNINEDNLTECYKDMLTNDQMLIIVEGVNNPIELLRANFTGNGSSKKLTLTNRFEAEACGLVTREDKTTQNNIFLIFDNLPLIRTKDNPASQMLCTMLGGSPNSLLFKTVREEHSLAYSISSQVNPYYGVMYIQGGIRLESLDLCLRLIDDAIEQLKSGELTDLLEKTKLGVISGIVEANDGKGYKVLQTLSGHYSDSFKSIEETIENIKAITIEDVAKVAKQIEHKVTYVIKGVRDNEKN